VSAAALSRRLGSLAARRRRHRRVAIAAGALLVVAIGLVLFGDGRDTGFDDDAAALCGDYVARIQNEFRLSFPEGVPSDAAFAEYASHAFADTMDDLLAALRALDPPEDVTEALDRYDDVLTELRARPEDFVAEQPFDEAAVEMDRVGPDGCGSEFFAALGGSQ
jgi:hypothetical protein